MQDDKRLHAKAQALQAYLEKLKAQLQGMLEAFTQATVTKTALEEVKKGREALIPIGAGSYVRGRIEEEMVVVPIGGGYFIEVPPEKAREMLDKTIERLKKMHEDISKEIVRVEGELVRILKSLNRHV